MQNFTIIKEQIRTRVDLVGYVSQFTALRQRGRSFIGLCPFHREKTPSFHVHPDRQFFKCFGCGAGGDLFKFVQLTENVDFSEALRMLADRAGVEMSAPTARRDAGDPGRSDLLAVNEWARSFFRAKLGDDRLGAAARQYLESRGFTADSIDRFGLGLAVGPDDALLRQARKRGFSERWLQAAGLCKGGDRGRLYDTFRDRLIFPIHDTTGRPIAFGGRTLVDAPAKYLNSPESPVFDKSASLFGLDVAKKAIHENRTAVLVEGYTDCIIAHQHGFSHVVASLGTAATDRQMALLHRYCDTLIVVFDGDQAGQGAADRALGTALKQGLNVRVAVLPDGMDPFDLLQNLGPERFRDVLNSSVDALRFSWDRTRTRFGESASPRDRKQAVAEFLSGVAELSEFGGLDAIQQGIILGQLSNLLSVPEGAIRTLLASKKRAVQVVPRNKAGTEAEPVPYRWRRPNDSTQSALIAILEAAIHESGVLTEVRDVFDPSRFVDPRLRSVAERVVALHSARGGFTVADLLAEIEDPAEAQLVTDLVTRHEACVDGHAGDTGRGDGTSFLWRRQEHERREDVAPDEADGGKDCLAQALEARARLIRLDALRENRALAERIQQDCNADRNGPGLAGDSLADADSSGGDRVTGESLKRESLAEVSRRMKQLANGFAGSGKVIEYGCSE